MLFERVAILGVGLIGGSFALALKQAQACAHVVGAGRNAANLKLALERGVIDSIAADAVAAAHGADLVLLAAPVAQFPKLFRDVASVLGPKAIVTDGGSTKRDVITAARSALGKRISQFVPAHPIAGAEKSGAAAASADAASRELRFQRAESPGCLVRVRRQDQPDGSRRA
jgi:prephenate dehydrogenase